MQQKILEFSVNDQKIRAPHLTVVADSRDYLVARFTFNETWRGLTKTAIFQGADGQAYYMLLEEDCCRVPEEVIQPTRFLVSVFAGDRITTDRAMVEVEASGFTPNGIDPPTPTPDVYNQLLDSVALDRQIAESAAKTAAEKAEECVNATATAELLLERAERTDVLAEMAEAYAHNASDFASEACGAAETATEAAQTATEAADTASAAARATTMKPLKTIILDEAMSRINVTFDKPLKEFYLVFTGKAVADTDAVDCILSCRTDGGTQFFFYSGPHKLSTTKDVVHISHAREMVERRWETTFSTLLDAGLQGISVSTATPKISYSKRPVTLSRYVKTLQLFVYNDICKFAVGSTLEVWGIEAE